jgi:uncharacterized membrane protein
MLSAKEPLGKFEMTMAAITVVLLLWIIVAPLTLSHESVKDLSGTVGPIDNSEQIKKMNLFAQAIYYFGDINCHQIDDRSYFLNGNEMPVCSRDLGIFIGLPIGFLLCFFLSFRPRFYLVILTALPIGIDGGLQAITSYESFNTLRLITGMIGGLAVTFFLVMIAVEIYKDVKLPGN